MLSQWRRLALFKQGLGTPQQFGEGLSGARHAIEHLGYVQIDTISVVERAHHHVLWNRVPGYDRGHLNSLISDQHIFEYWYHAAAYLPMRDYRYALPQMALVRSGENRYYSHGDKHLMNEILARVKAQGPMRQRDVDKGDKGQGNWWNWGPGRRAVETLFMQGDLMVCERNGMEKVYDLAERCVPGNIDLSMPTLIEYAAYLLDTTLRAHGVFTWKQLLHLKVGKPLRDAMRKVLDERIDAGAVKALDSTEGMTAYVDVAAFEQAPTVDPGVKILSPFDNLVIHRDRLASLFEFDYRIECYVAAPKRLFGYFCLPILYGDRLVGRIDCKAHRGEQRLEVLSLHLENGKLDEDAFFQALGGEMQRFADFNKCPILDVRAIDRMRRRQTVQAPLQTHTSLDKARA
ncbi:winged helix-turn-helix domain-containing protein [Verminephrobacter aporrectodeae]|uniref:winged helix-turn-helix domain-containing protein n=1 Tax=Verminephrobacter aporrectodeae TaxID=1110389 RepID=UPI00023750BC|nr:crosslink repair DNA glycosylase YcaQ family protein [Verminephrobacter aporrectodeae]